MQRSLALIPSTLTARINIRFADSMAQGLLEAIAEFRADMVIIGAASTGPFRRFTVGFGFVLFDTTKPDDDRQMTIRLTALVARRHGATKTEKVFAEATVAAH